MEERVITNLLKDVKIPKMVKVRQKFERNRINKDDIPNVIFSQLENEKFSSLIKPGMKICITCGSRGISNIPLIIKKYIRTVETDVIKLRMFTHNIFQISGKIAVDLLTKNIMSIRGWHEVSPPFYIRLQNVRSNAGTADCIII